MSSLQSFQVFFDQVQSKDTLFKGIGPAPEQRCFSTILEELKGACGSGGIPPWKDPPATPGILCLSAAFFQ